MDHVAVTTTHQENPIHALLGGRRGSLESALPPVLFVTASEIIGQDPGASLAAALAAALVLAS